VELIFAFDPDHATGSNMTERDTVIEIKRVPFCWAQARRAPTPRPHRSAARALAPPPLRAAPTAAGAWRARNPHSPASTSLARVSTQMSKADDFAAFKASALGSFLLARLASTTLHLDARRDETRCCNTLLRRGRRRQRRVSAVEGCAGGLFSRVGPVGVKRVVCGRACFV